MKQWIALAGAALLGACATTAGSGAPSPQWLAGTWLMLGPDIEYPLACASGLPIAYNADGTYQLFEERGTWRLDGDRLTETVTEADDGEAEAGATSVNRIRRLGRDRMTKTFEDGATEALLRCPPPG